MPHPDRPIPSFSYANPPGTERTDASATASMPRLHPEHAQVIDLPPRLSAVIGREDDLDILSGYLLDPAVRLITLTGPGGVGKTRLAVEAGYRHTPAFRQIHHIPLAAIAESEAVLPAIARAMAITTDDPEVALERIPSALPIGERVLLILDNMEQVIAAAPDVARLLSRAPTLTMLVTSREALRLPDERIQEVPTLEVPPVGGIDTNDWGAFPAVELFVASVQRFDPTFTLDSCSAPIIGSICRRLDGLPLAIELAAARIKLFSLEALHDRIADQIDVLGGGPRDQPAHQRTMRATIAWSYALLQESEQRAFRALSWFGTPFTHHAAHVVMLAETPDPDVRAELLESLADKHLLRRRSGTDGDSGFLMLMTIRVFGREVSRSLGEEAMRRDAHAAWIAEFTTSASAERPDGTVAADTLAAIERTLPDIERALAWYEDRRQPESLLHLTIALAPFWTHRFARAEGRRWFERALALAGPDTPELPLARAELELAALCRTSRTGDPIDAIRIAERAHARYLRLGDEMGIVASLNLIGVLQRGKGDHEQAIRTFENALARSILAAHPWWHALILCNLGATALWRGETREARHRLEEAVRGFRDLGDRRGIAFTLHILALVRCTQGDARAAAAIAGEGLTEAVAVAAMETTIDLIAAAGVIAAAGGDFAIALTLLEGADILSGRAMYRIERPERDVYEEAERIARRALGLSQTEQHRREVERLTLDEAVTLAAASLAHGATVPVASRNPDATTPELALQELTVRERQVFALMTQRYTDKEIGETLDISVRTVSRHVSNIFTKLGIRSRREVLTRYTTNPDPTVTP
ncbi:MAG: LuxR C-terminal-related transcriptional regulator [Thermomicrobiales bacterium]